MVGFPDSACSALLAVTNGDIVPVLTAITVQPMPEHVTELRHRIVGILEERGIEPRQRDRVALALSELATNAVLHGSRNPIRIEMAVEGDDIDLLVVQEADGDADGDLVPDRATWRLPDDRSQIGGRGLAIVASVADEIDVHVGTARTEIRVRFSPRTSQPTETRH